MQHREACVSALNFVGKVSDLAANATATSCLEVPASTLLEEQLNTKGPQLINLLLAGAAGTLPSSRIPDVGDTFAALLRSRGAGAVQWVTQAVAALPEVALLPADKEAFLAKASVMAMNVGMETQQSEFQEALDAVADLCRRNKRARVAAQQALLPLGLHGLIA
jgi:transportin-3